MRKAGEVTYGAAHDGEVGKNRGIVCFERKKDAERAIDDLDGRELNGRTVSYQFFFDQPKYEILAPKVVEKDLSCDDIFKKLNT